MLEFESSPYSNPGSDIKILKVKILWPWKVRWWPHGVHDCISPRWDWTHSNYYGQGMLLCDFSFMVPITITIAWQAHLSSKHKQFFLDIQSSNSIKLPWQLQVDMPVRWSSTYVMLERAKKLRDVSNELQSWSQPCSSSFTTLIHLFSNLLKKRKTRWYDRSWWIFSLGKMSGSRLQSSWTFLWYVFQA